MNLKVKVVEGGYIITNNDIRWLEQIDFIPPEYIVRKDDGTIDYLATGTNHMNDIIEKKLEEEKQAVTMELLKETNDAIGAQLSQTLIQVMMLQQQVAALSNTPA